MVVHRALCDQRFIVDDVADFFNRNRHRSKSNRIFAVKKAENISQKVNYIFMTLSYPLYPLRDQ